MRKKLIVPEDSPGKLRLSLGLRSFPYERPARDRDAQLFAVLICTTLWGFFWLQFVIGMGYNLPAMWTLSRGNWFHPGIEFYFRNHGPFPWSLAGTFAVLSIFASILGLVGGWLCSVGVVGKWRMRTAVVIFSMILSGWSVAALNAEGGAWIGLEERLKRAEFQWRTAGERGEDEWSLRFYRKEIEGLERLLDLRNDK